MASEDLKNVLIIGIGNEFRSDDGVGPFVVRQIEKLKLPGVTTRIESGEGASLIEAWRGFQRVLVIDATDSGKEAGQIWRLDAARQRIPSQFFNYSTHAFSLAEAVELARAMGGLPPQFYIYGIEGSSFSAGCEMTDAVRNAAKQVVEEIRNRDCGRTVPERSPVAV